ncbi:MAG: hypothetical protein ACRDKB_06550 [Actinomycetota bacterium]
MGKGRATARRSKGTPRRYRNGRAVSAKSASRTRDPGLWHLARRTAATAAELVELESPFLAECWLSSLVSIWEDAYLVDADPEKVIGLSVVDAAASEASPRALALLSGLAVLGGKRVGPRARTEARRLDGRRDEAPRWLDALGRARLVGSWKTHEPFGDGDMVTLVLQHAGYQAHAIGVLIDHNLGSMAKDVLVADDAGSLKSLWEHEVPGVTVVDIDTQEAADALAHGLEIEGMYLNSPATEELREFRPLLRCYLRTLPSPRAIHPPSFDERDRDRLAAEFAASVEAHGLDPAVIDDLACRVVDFGCDYSDGDPLRWSPTVVELFMTDWLPRKALLEAPLKGVPDTVRAWVRFAGRKRGLNESLIEETVTAVERWEREFAKAMKDSTRFGPAKAIVGAMLAEGIELTDQASVDAWIRDFNGRPEEQRRKVLP